MLSVCIITKNEEHNLARCLKSFQNTGFELIVADTGSTDQTKKIAAEYTENIYDFPWCDDFSAAKNFAVSKAAYPYVMVIDSDEFLQQIDMPELEKLIAAHTGSTLFPEKTASRRIRNGLTVFSQKKNFIIQEESMNR